MDKRVEIHGTSRADINGKCDVATNFHYHADNEGKWRYTVQLDSGVALKSPPPPRSSTQRARGSISKPALQLPVQLTTNERGRFVCVLRPVADVGPLDPLHHVRMLA